jgi:membrane-bound lytic murein transglycosylase B
VHAGQGIDQRRLAGVGAAGKGDLDALRRRQLFELGHPQAETRRAAEQTAALIDLVSPEAPTEYWLGFDNFYVITRYNRSSFYAMSVFQLAEALREQRELASFTARKGSVE